MKDIRIMAMVEPFVHKTPNAPAIFKENGMIVTYRQIHKTVGSMSEFLFSRGVDIKHRVGVIANDGAAITMAYLAVSNIASFVPLSPDYSEEQYRYYFSILKIDMLLIPESYDSSIQRIAEELNIQIFFMQESANNSEELYQIMGGSPDQKREMILAKGQDIATVLFTSGTTSLPKIVPRSHINTYFSTLKRIEEMNLTAQDCTVFTFPVFRGISIHDTLAVLAAGGSLIYANGSSPETIHRMIEDHRPTWLTGSPVLFHALAEYHESRHLNQMNSSLRSVRSSGAPLSNELRKRMEDIFSVSIYAAYGLTETGNISSNQNSPAGLKPGSVGVPKNVDVAIFNESGEKLDRNQIGEIAVRGPQVITRYDNDEEINKASFYGEWFRTGDSGYLDEDGYLFITGRFKEIINRGGEKVSPYEIENAISKHPDVLQVAVFPISNQDGNEDVGAAVKLREGSRMYLKDLRRFLNGKVAAFKMPVKLYIMQEIPFSEAGKVQRKKLYEKIIALKISPQPEADVYEPIILPRNDTEAKLYVIFKKILPVKKISVTDSFFELGGDSLKAAALFTEIREVFKLQIPLKHIFKNGTIESLADYIINNSGSRNVHPFLVPFQEEGSKTPIFFVHAAEGESVIYRHIATDFDPERPFYGIDFNPKAVRWVHPITFEQMAGRYIKDIRRIQPEGPYLMAGLCVGGIIAYEIVRQLKEAKQEVSFLGIFDPIIPGTNRNITMQSKLQRNKDEIKRKGIRKYLANKWFYYRIRLLSFLYGKSIDSIKPYLLRFMDKNSIINYSRSNYVIKEYAGDITIFQPIINNNATVLSMEIWTKLAKNVRIIPIQGRHETVFYAENAENTKSVLLKELADIK